MFNINCMHYICAATALYIGSNLLISSVKQCLDNPFDIWWWDDDQVVWTTIKHNIKNKVNKE